MYGLLHLSIMEMVKAKFGVGAWNEVLKRSELDEDEHFLMYRWYPDSDIVNLLQTVSQTLRMSYNTVLENFGDYHIQHLSRCGYRQFLSFVGVDFVTFMQNLDSLHSLATYAFSVHRMPSFRCHEKEDGTVVIHYYSERNFLLPTCVGILRAVARDLFNQTALVTVVSGDVEQKQVAPQRTVYHGVLEVQLMDGAGEKRRVDWAMGDPHQYQKIRRHSCLGSAYALHDHPGTETILRAEDFRVAFPYHMVLDSSLCVLQCGEDIVKLSKADIQQGTPFTQLGVIVKPLIYHTVDTIRQFINNNFVISIPRKGSEKPLILKGQMIWLSHSHHLLFMGSPRFTSFDDLVDSNLFLADLPLYDTSRELLHFIQQYMVVMEVIKKQDEIRLMLKKMSRILEEERRRSEDLLHEMMPSKIAQQLMEGNIVLGEIYETCTVLFSDIKSFTEIASKCSAVDVIHMLNEMYYRFDMHTDEHKVYKVKTIGDAYMAVTGVPEVQEDHAELMADFAMDMIEESYNVLSPATGQPLMIRVGMHSGDIVAGVVGLKKPRYDIYGNTVNTASRMESYSAPGRIHVSLATFSLLYPSGYKFLVREQAHMKGKGSMKTFFLVGYLDRNIPQPEDKHETLPAILAPNPTTARRTDVHSFRALGPITKKLSVISTHEYSERTKGSRRRSLKSRIVKMSFVFSSLGRGSERPKFIGFRRNQNSLLSSPNIAVQKTLIDEGTGTSRTGGDLQKTKSRSLFAGQWSARVSPQTSSVKTSVATMGAADTLTVFGPVSVVPSKELVSSSGTMFSPYFGKHSDEEEEEYRGRCRKICACVLL